MKRNPECAVGLEAVARDPKNNHYDNEPATFHTLREVLRRYHRWNQNAVCTWNDTPGRTFDEVLRVAKEADELLDAS